VCAAKRKCRTGGTRQRTVCKGRLLGDHHGILKGRSLSESWGSRPFDIANSAHSYSFTHAFRGPTDSDRFLRDLASQDALVLFFGPGMLTSLPLKASDAVTKLRECSSKIVEQAASDGLQE
jgi:hypothetical protein